MTSVGDVEMMLEEWLTLLDIKEEGNYIVIHARKYLGKEVFSGVLAKVRQGGGEYMGKGKVNQGENPYFRILKASGAQGSSVEVKVAGLLYCPRCGGLLRLEKA